MGAPSGCAPGAGKAGSARDGGGGAGGSGGGGRTAQLASIPKINAAPRNRNRDTRFMTLILLEALGALVLLLLIVWWTMFSGRQKGELPGQHDTPPHHEDHATREADAHD